MYKRIREWLKKWPEGQIKTGCSTLVHMAKMIEMLVDAGEELEAKVAKLEGLARKTK